MNIDKITFILNIILFIFLYKIYKKMNNKENFITDDKLGYQINDVFNDYFNMTMVPIRKLAVIIKNLDVGNLNGNLIVKGNTILKKNLLTEGNSITDKNMKIDNTFTIDKTAVFANEVAMDNDIMVSGNCNFGDMVYTKNSYNYYY